MWVGDRPPDPTRAAEARAQAHEGPTRSAERFATSEHLQKPHANPGL